jgi:hypothetical protein
MKKFLLVFVLLIVGGFYLFGGVNNFPPSSGTSSQTDTSPSLTTTNAGDVTINFTSGIFQQLVITNTTTLLVPTNGATGSRLELWITASGADRSLTITNSITFPSDSAFTGTKTLTSNQTYIVILRSPNGTNWWLQTLVGGY